MAIVNKFNVNNKQVTLDADIIENMSANDVSYDASTQYNENTVGNKLSELDRQVRQVIYDVSANNDGMTFASLSELLSNENLSTLIPTSVRHGGMSIRFIQSSDNKYVQYRLISDTFNNTVDNWQGVDDVPTSGSKNLIKSGGVHEEIYGSLHQITPESNITNCQLSDKKLKYNINFNKKAAFFSVESGKTYKIHIPSTTEYSFCYCYTNVLVNSPITEDTSLGDDAKYYYYSYDKSEFNAYTTAQSGFAYIAIAAYRDVPTLEEVVDNDVVLYKKQYQSDEKKQVARGNIGAYSQDEGSLIAGKVNDMETTLAYNLSQDEYFIPDVLSAENILPQGDGFLGNNNMATDYIKVKSGNVIKVVSANRQYTGFCETVPVINASIVGYKHYNPSELLKTEIVSPIDGYFAVGRYKTEAISEITIYNKGLQAQINNIINKTEYNAFFPKYIYDVDNKTRQIIQRIRIESLVNSRVRLKINNGNCFLVHKFGGNKSTVETTSADISLEDNFGLSKSGSVNIVTTKSSAITGKLVKYLAIGDSWCAANYSKDLHGNTDTPWNYECSVIDNFMKTNIDLQDEISKIISIGFIGKVDDRTLTYNGQSYTLRSRNEGRGGWSAQSYLRHPVLVRTPGSEDISGKAAWDAIGLGRKELYGEAYDESVIYTEYTGSVEQITEYLTTAMGYYHWDYSTELMNWLGIEGTYNGTEEQKTGIDGKMTSMLTWKWDGNPFYDWDTAISSRGAYAFSFSKYLERYKTREEDGVTPLVMGETAGTKIQYNSQITDYAVCTPTHVTIELGINDYSGLTINQSASDIELLAQLIHAHDQNIKVGIVQLHVPGSFYPSIYSGEGLFSSMDDWTVNRYVKRLFELNKKISDDIADYRGVNGIYHVPTYYVFGNLMDGASIQKDAVGNELILDGTDFLHASHNEHLEIGYQIYSWIVYTLTQS